MAKPKLALIPAAQGSKFYSVLPSDGVGDFDFARASAATRINKYGLIETVASGQSRLNYPLIDGVVNGCPHHILEPARTNLIQYSEDTTTWGKNQTPVVTLNQGISPDGSQTADKAVVDLTSEGFYNFNAGTVTSGVTYAVSIFIKYISGVSNIQFGFAGTGFGGDNNNVFNIVNGTIVSSFANSTNQIINYGNGWFRLTCTKTATATNTGGFILYGNENAEIQYYLWGAQFELGSYPTSYIPNFGTALGVTRSAETANNSGDVSTFNSSEGVLMAEISGFENDLLDRYISISDGTLNNAIKIFYYQDGGTTFFRKNVNGAQTTIVTTSSINKSELTKIAVKYNSTNFDIFSNGVKISTNLDSNSFPIGTLNEINFSNADGLSQPFYGNVKQIQYYDSALTDSELETLTSWTSFSEMATSQLYSIQ
jgi:hypothetical protein